jgi:hypothetical protein
LVFNIFDIFIKLKKLKNKKRLNKNDYNLICLILNSIFISKLEKSISEYKNLNKLYLELLEIERSRINALIYRRLFKINQLVNLKKYNNNLNFEIVKINNLCNTNLIYNKFIQIKNTYKNKLIRQKFINIIEKKNCIDKKISERVIQYEYLYILKIKNKINIYKIMLYYFLSIHNKFNIINNFARLTLFNLLSKILFLDKVYKTKIEKSKIPISVMFYRKKLFFNVEIRRRILRKFYKILSSYKSEILNYSSIKDLQIKIKNTIEKTTKYSKDNEFNISRLLNLKNTENYIKNKNIKIRSMRRLKSYKDKTRFIVSKFWYNLTLKNKHTINSYLKSPFKHKLKKKKIIINIIHKKNDINKN